MDMNDEKILAIKAFYLGHKINENPASKSGALEMISSAIVQLIQQSARADRLHLAFYHLLRSEVMRVDHDVVGDRMAAKAICEEIASSLYRYFMTIEQVTLAEKKLLNATDTSAYAPGEYLGHELVFNCLGLVYENLDPEQMLFIDHATLLDLFNMHGLQC